MHPLLSGVVVHWRNEELLAGLAAAWPRDPRFELIVVGNGSSGPLETGPARLVRPGENLGFGGGANAGAAEARGEILLFLNPDAVPEPGALDRLLEGFERHPDAAGLAPRLVGPGGESQAGWQLRRVTDHMNQNLGEECTIMTLAALVGISPFHFARSFKASTGVSPGRYQSLLRLARAKETIANSNRSITDVARDVGFETSNGLTRLFQRELGMSPRTYRRETRG